MKITVHREITPPPVKGVTIELSAMEARDLQYALEEYQAFTTAGPLLAELKRALQ